MPTYEKFEDLQVARAPVRVEAMAPHVVEGLRAAGYLRLLREADQQYEAYLPEADPERQGWLHAMDDQRPFCGSADSPGPWEVDEAGTRMRLHSWGSSHGRWDVRALTWAVDPTGCLLGPASTVDACRTAFSDWQDALTSLVDGSRVVTLTEAANLQDADITIRFGGKELDPSFGADGGVAATGGYPDAGHRGRIVVDEKEQWFDAAALAAVLRHEIGHVLGLSHSDSPGALMYPIAVMPTIDPETRLAVRLLYGFPDQRHLSDRGTVGSPAMCTDGTTAYAAWRGSDGDALIYLAEFTKQWSAQSRAVGGSSHGPGIAWHQGGLWLAWKGMRDDQRLFVSAHTKGKGWSPQQALDGKGSAAGPALATFDGDLWMFWRGIGDDQSLYCARMDGAGRWGGQMQINGAGSSHGPSAIEHDGRLWVLWKGIGEDAAMYYTSRGTDRNDLWDAPTRLSWTENEANGKVRRYPGTAAEPCLFVRSGQLWATWRGITDDPQLWCSRMDATGWCGQIQLRGGSAEGPAARSTASTTVFLWRGIDHDPSLYTVAF